MNLQRGALSSSSYTEDEALWKSPANRCLCRLAVDAEAGRIYPAATTLKGASS
jgi:hypothetical protein